ncbi:cyclohexadienyl dehydratase [Povalibacter uvarum]|uniref:chorismate mutase n=1 Tax=Povalibacter uvarum TaxID=732238 RepID=A0A841HPL0_9GAMM|nr:gamma subclass chorismate mutase AroQ [Povalibacter uvarum]MBB6094574.1 cyclohexadienyl dehydratase [Povalibacter uvarum]
MPRFFLIPFIALCALSLPARADEVHFDDPAADVAAVFDLIEQRLALMPAVASWKYAKSLPVVDADREQVVLDATVARAEKLGIEPGSARTLFALQIEIARRIQAEKIDAWRSGREQPPPVRDLARELRPALDDIGDRLLRAIYLALPELQRPGFANSPAALQWQKRFGADAAKLVGALAALRDTPVPALARIKASAVLRIGTTGDYAPFSSDAGGILRGADIDAAVQLAKALGVEPHFVRTSWPTLMGDYRGGRFDIAMSGISITAERAAEAAFSASYHRGGKTPIVRCGRETSLDTLEEIDQPGTRVVVNPGGTNERFVREHIARAKVSLHPDNRTIFDEIRLGRADVMITDDVEVELQVRGKPGLCRATPATFTQGDKAILMLRDGELLKAVDGWLANEQRSGAVTRRLESALATAPVH